MDFKQFLQMVNEAESTAEKDDKAERAAKKVAKDIEYDEGHKGNDDDNAEKAGKEVKKDIEYDNKKDEKKSLKDWFEIIDKNMLNEAEQVTMEPAKQNTQVIKQGTKTLGTVSNPQLAAQIKQSIGKGEMSLAGHEMKEEAEDNPESAMLEKWAGDAEVKPTGQYKDKSKEELKSMLSKLHKSGPHDKDSLAAKKMRQINFALRAKGGWKSGEGAAMKEEVEQVDEVEINEVKRPVTKDTYDRTRAPVTKDTYDRTRAPVTKDTYAKKQAANTNEEVEQVDEASKVPVEGIRSHLRGMYGSGTVKIKPHPGLPGHYNATHETRDGESNTHLIIPRKSGRGYDIQQAPYMTSSYYGEEAELDEGATMPINDPRDNLDRLDPEHPGNRGAGMPIKDRIKRRVGQDYYGKGRSAAGKPPIHDYANKPHLPEEVEQVDEKAKNAYAIGMAAAKKAAGIKAKHATDLPKSVVVKGHEIAKKIKKTDEAQIPNSGPDYGAGLGAGRNDKVLEAKPDFLDLDKDGNKKESMKKAAADKKKKVKESMNTLEAAYHEGKSHGLSKHSYACRYNEGSDEHKRYHDGFKEGLDECYGLMPNRGLVVGEGDMPAATVPGMAHQAMPAKEGWKGSAAGAGLGAMLGGPLGAAAGAVVGDKVGDEMDEGNAFTAALAKTPKGGKFSVGGKTFIDNSNYSAKVDEYAFESLDKQLEALINEDVSVNEGLSVSMSTGQQGSPDSVSVTGTDDEAGKLLAFIKQVGLGGIGADAVSTPAEPAVAVVSDYGAPKFSGHDDMVGLMKVASDDYKDEESHDEEHGEVCNECGMNETKCGCDESAEMIDEVETPDQLEYQVAEDDGEGYEQSQADAGKIDAALAMSGTSKGGATNEDGAEAPGSNPVGQAEQEEAEEVNEESQAEKDDHAERAAKKVAKDIEYDEGHKGNDDDNAEKAGKEVKKDIEYDDKKDKKLDEWANDAGKDGTQQSFMRDIEFMTKVISGGLNKPKSTGQTTIPVIAGQEAREGDEDVKAWKKLAGLAK